ncbi:MAG: hypothetical protein JXB36_11115, partial [Gammaproteobacteria bacterium]|nr:hypothetical protein [Gammaproteobacteria bacterium]
LLPAAGVLVAAAVVAASLPNVYRSRATVLIEELDVPAELLPANAAFASRRLDVIRQRVLTTENAAEIATRHGLYGADETARPASVLAQQLNRDVHVNLVSADTIDPRSGRSGQTVIAFTLAVDSESAAAAQQVAGELVDLFLKENVRSSEDRAADVVTWLDSEAERFEAELLQVESKLAAFKAENAGAMPEMYDVNVASLDRADQELTALTARIGELQKRRLDLMADLSQQHPDAPVVLSNGTVVMSDRQRLQGLHSERRALSAVYGPDHPDLVKLNREIANLEAALGVEGDSPGRVRGELREAEGRLAALRERYADEHPEVAQASAVVASLREQLASLDEGSAPTAAPTNPAYLMVSSQLQGVDIELRSAEARRVELERRIEAYRELIERAPAVEQQYQALVRDHATASAKYQDLRAKQREAEIARNVASVSQSSRLTLLEPPALPLAPIWPNRQAILLLGLLLAAGAGAATVVVAQVLDKSVRGAHALAALTGSRPLAVVPYIRNRSEARADALRGYALKAGAAAAVLAVGVWYVIGG